MSSTPTPTLLLPTVVTQARTCNRGHLAISKSQVVFGKPRRPRETGIEMKLFCLPFLYFIFPMKEESNYSLLLSFLT